MFVGRKAEFAELERRYAQEGFQFPVVYGRRRVGKTRLIQEFANTKKSIYFMATKQTSSELLQCFSLAVKEQLADERTKYLSSFESWESLFSYVTEISRNERLVLVIDEYPYLAESEKSISSLLQKYIDNEWKETQLYLILCGSSMSFMEEQVLEYGSPLYGRKCDEIRPITCEVNVLPRLHGSALFTCGETQSLTVTTLGTVMDVQVYDDIDGERSENFILHYNFPPTQ